jgi:hypothetical protein
MSMILEIFLLLLSDNQLMQRPEAVFERITFESMILKNYGLTILMQLLVESVKKQLFN